MKKDLFRSMLLVLFALFVFTACSDDDNNNEGGQLVGNFVAGEEVVYSNAEINLGTPVENAADLSLKYEGSVLPGKVVSFVTSDGKKADIKLNAVLPHETTTALTVDLTKSDNSYTFSGNATSAAGTTFTYEGSATKEGLNISLTNIKIPANSVTEHGTWYLAQFDGTASFGFHLSMATEDVMSGNAFSYLGTYMVSQIFNSLLKSVTFHDNGIITAEYNPQLSMSMMDETAEISWIQSPEIPLATYFVQGEKMYVTPNIEAIMAIANAAKTKAEESTEGPSEAEIQQAIAVLMAQAQKWTTEGICLKIQAPGKTLANDMVTPVQLLGDMELVLGYDELKPVLEVLPTLSSVLIPMLPADIAETLEGILPVIASATDLNVGIVLNKELTVIAK